MSAVRFTRPLILVVVLASPMGCSGSVAAEPGLQGPGDGASAAVTGVAGPILFHAESVAASDFGSGFGSGGFYVYIAGQDEACLSVEQVRAPNGRTVLWFEWPDDRPRTLPVGDQNISIQLSVENASNNYASPAGSPTSGGVIVDELVPGSHVDGSYDLTFEGGVALSGSFRAPISAQVCWP